ncbi:pseudaminic acid synthase [Namhaeicola litoreus]|uniref:Pseudaminic acid synthase n=1 Tax=Namhaeicola litoreus TaxID=1052145 RepID=A0ABW3Y4P2_9FLAO
MKIDDFKLGKGKTFIIAELSANHGHDIEIAKETIRAAKRAGADAIKLQTYTADTITLDCDKDDFIIKGTIWAGRKLYDLYKEAFLPWEWHADLFKVAEEEGLICFSSPFDKTAVDFLEDLQVPAYKIASFEITDIPLIEYAASKGKPMIMSTGIADDKDIQLAVDVCRNAGNNEIILLKTSSQYPAKIEDANLLMIPDLAKRYGVLSGLSDHTSGELVAITATALGAVVIEKHFILNKSIGGPDASFSLDEKAFKKMVKAVRSTEKSLGKVDYSLTAKAKKSREFSRSLYVIKDVKAGEKLSDENVRSIRPGFGLHPKYFDEVIGKSMKCDVSKGSRLNKDNIAI